MLTLVGRCIRIKPKKMKVFIQSIPREGATNVHEFRDFKSGKKLNKTKISKFCKDKYGPLYSAKIGGLATGLLDMVDNPWYVDTKQGEIEKLKMKLEPLEVKKDKTEKELKEYQKFGQELEDLKKAVRHSIDSAKSKMGRGWEYLTDKVEISRQELLEKKHGRSPGYYNNTPYRRGDDMQKITYMQKFTFPLNDGSTILDTNNAEHEIAYYVFLASKKIANSKKEWLEHKWPYATHYISLQEEDEEIALKARKIKNQAIVALSSEEMTDENKDMIVKALGWAKVSLTPKQLYNLISSKIESANTYNKDNDATLFMKKADMLKTPIGREQLRANSLLNELVNERIVSGTRDTYIWITRGIKLGDSKEEAIDFLIDPNKQSQTDQLKKELKAKILV